MKYSLAALAEHVDGVAHGDPELVIEGVAPLYRAGVGQITFLTRSSFRKHLSQTQAAAVILRQSDVDACPTAALIVNDPYLAYARIAALFIDKKVPPQGVHASAVVASDAHVAASAWVGPNSVIESGACIAEGVFIGPGCVVGGGVEIGRDSRLVANVTLCEGVVLGQRVLLHPGAVIGADGFGFANDQGRWVHVPQLGTVRLGDDVEVGANTTIDRGALDDTVVEEGVKLDNLIQIGHNVRIGAHSAFAACAAVSGSATIGRHCTLAGGVGLVGHIELTDNVHITGMSMVTHSITEPGVYSAGVPLEPNRQWRRNFVRFKQLDDMARRLKALEKQLDEKEEKG